MSESSDHNGQFSFMDELVLRTPALPFVPLLEEAMIDELIGDGSFLEAVYLASPVLYAECIRLQKGELTDAKEIKKIRISLAKYYERMYSRCTPFGLFSGCSLVKWSDTSSQVILPSKNFLRSTRLDMHYLCALGQHLSSHPSIKERLLYFPNNSHYKMGDELRYIEYHYFKGRRAHQISSVLYSGYLQFVLDHSREGAGLSSLVQMLAGKAEVPEEEAREFVEDMIVSQVLISEMDPAITGEEFIHQLLGILKRINNPQQKEISTIIFQLEEIVGSLNNIDAQIHQPPAMYMSLAEKIKEAGVSFEENKLFQVDMYSKPVQHTIHEDHKAELLKAVELLGKLFSSTTNDNLTSFADRFRKRYEDQVMPLLQVLDGETGIGYTEQSGRNLSPLLENIAMPSTNDRDSYDIKWNRTEQWLFQLLINNKNKNEIILEEGSLAEFSGDRPVFPASMSLLFSLVEEDKLVFRGASGSSAANLLGRFAHADNNIHELVLKIASHEQSINQSVYFTEIIHLPEDRVGNILLHPAFREFEIPFLARSSLPVEQQVALQDLLISVGQDKRIRLFSKKLDKEIIPRLSSAHNYGFGSLPVYHFLAELQTQGQVIGLTFNWGSMARQFRFLPRVRYGNTILFEATWQLRKEDIESLLSQKEYSMIIVERFRSKWELPRMLVLADGDNELLVDLESKVSVETFISTIKGRELVILKEFLMPASLVKDEKTKPYNNQLVAVLMNNTPVYTNNRPAFNETQPAHTKRKFLPGTEWLYYKIYCGSKTADEILLRCIQPLTEELLQKGYIDKWFFIRYNDPAFHLRLRFHIPDHHHYGKIAELLLRSLEEMDKEGLIISVQADTYQRELERYGYALVELAEDLFFTDSKMKLAFLQLTEGDEREKLRWLWGLRGADELLNAFKLSLAEKYELMRSFQQAFATEFKAGKTLFRQINQQYNENRNAIKEIMESPVAGSNTYSPWLDIFKEHETEIMTTASGILTVLQKDQQVSLPALLSGYIHMNLNRLFLSEPRQHELLIYDFLCSWYRSQVKKS